jgi:hypothetical protein
MERACLDGDMEVEVLGMADLMVDTMKEARVEKAELLLLHLPLHLPLHLLPHLLLRLHPHLLLRLQLLHKLVFCLIVLQSQEINTIPQWDT